MSEIDYFFGGFTTLPLDGSLPPLFGVGFELAEDEGWLPFSIGTNPSLIRTCFFDIMLFHFCFGFRFFCVFVTTCTLEPDLGSRGIPTDVDLG